MRLRVNSRSRWRGLRSISQSRSPLCIAKSPRPLRARDSASPGLGKWQRKRLENQEFERRLFEMKRERETRLNNSETLEEQQLLMREISALEGRIVRCRQARDEIERVIERLTR